jgi:hypothetical protein
VNVPPTETAPAPAACPHCAAPHAPGQEYCLECGGRLPGGVVASLATGWRRRFRWYPGDWIWPALVSLLVAAIATGAVVAATWKSGSGSTIVATGPASRATTTTTAGLTAPTAPTEPAQPPPPPPPPSGPIAWPAGRSGFTVVLESIPTSAGRSLALARARAASRAGLPQVGILDSGRYSSLHPGYFVVFSGIYTSKGQADSAQATAAEKGFRLAYSREITR